MTSNGAITKEMPEHNTPIHPTNANSPGDNHTPIGLTKPKKKRSRKATSTRQRDTIGDNDDDDDEETEVVLATKVWKKDFSSTKTAAIKRCNDTKKQIRLIESSSQMLSLDITAGYVGLKDVTSLRNWFAVPNIHSRVLEWAELVKYRHDLKLKVTQTGNQSQITVELTKTIVTLMHWADGGKPAAVEDIREARLAREPHFYGKGETGKSAVPYINIASSAMTFLLSPDGPLLKRRLTPEQQAKASQFLGWKWEDWSRAIHAVKCAAKDLARKPNANAKDRVAPAREFPAVLPNFLSSEDIDGVIGEGLMNDEDELAAMHKFDDEIERTRALRRYEHLLAASNPEDRMVAGLGLSSTSDILYNTDASKLLTNTTNLEKVIREAFKKTPERVGILNGKTARPKANKWALLDFCADLTSRVKVSWDEAKIIEARSQALLEHKAFKVTDIEEVARLQSAAEQDEGTGGKLAISRVDDGELSKDKAPLDSEKLKAFSDLLNNFMSNVSATFPSIQEAREWGGFGPDEPLIIQSARISEDGQPVTLLPYQLIAAYYMYLQENTPIHASLIALACGLGKTLVTLFFVWRSVHHRKIYNQGKDRDNQKKYAVSLIIVPGASIEVWYLDVEKFFPGVLKMYAWYGSLITVKSEKRRETLISPSTDALQEHLDSFDPYEPKTGLNIVATAHTTWYKRALGTCLETELMPDIRRPSATSGSKVSLNLHMEMGDNIIEEDDGEVEEGLTNMRGSPQETAATKLQTDRLQDQKEEARKAGRAFYCKIVYKFWRTIIDEAHLLRNLDTYLAEAVMQTQKENCHFLTATPLLNHPRDLGGYLFQICQVEWLIPRLPSGTKAIYSPKYNPRDHNRRIRTPSPRKSRANSQDDTDEEDDENDPSRPIQNLLKDIEHTPQRQGFIKAIEDGYPLYIFDVRNYRTTGYYSEWSPEVCRTMMHAILPYFMLRIGNGTEIDLGGSNPRYIVGEDIPKCNFFTLTLEMNEDERVVHDDITMSLLSLLGVGSTGHEDKNAEATVKQVASTEADRQQLRDIIESDGIVDQGIYRLLKHVTLDPNLAKLTLLNHRDACLSESKQVAIPNRNNWTGQDTDNGASYYFIRTRDHPKYALPQDVLTLAHYMVSLSPKLRWLIGRLAPLVFKQKKKAVVISEFPMTQWDIEANLTNLGFTYAAINSKMTQEERGIVIEDFNDPNSGTMILLITTTLGSVSLNLQAACSHVYIMDIPIRFYDIVQILGRVHRIGQREEQNVYMLYLQDSFDQYCLARMIRKMVASLGGEGTTFTDDHISIDAQNKLMLWLGLQYSMHDACWSLPPWKNRTIHTKVADRMRAVTGGFLYRSDVLKEIAPDAFPNNIEDNDTPSKSRRSNNTIGVKRIQNIKARDLPPSEHRTSSEEVEMQLKNDYERNRPSTPTQEDAVEDEDLYDATPIRPSKPVVVSSSGVDNDNESRDAQLCIAQENISPLASRSPQTASQQNQPSQSDAPIQLDRQDEPDRHAQLAYPPPPSSSSLSSICDDISDDVQIIHNFQGFMKHRETLIGVQKGQFTKKVKEFVTQHRDAFIRLDYDVLISGGHFVVPNIPNSISDLPEYQRLGLVTAKTFDTSSGSSSSSLKRTNSTSNDDSGYGKRVRR